MVVGKKYWVIPDCELPPEGEGVLKGHESVVIVNDSNKKAVIKVKLYFSDKFKTIYYIDRFGSIRYDKKQAIY